VARTRPATAPSITAATAGAIARARIASTGSVGIAHANISACPSIGTCTAIVASGCSMRGTGLAGTNVLAAIRAMNLPSSVPSTSVLMFPDTTSAAFPVAYLASANAHASANVIEPTLAGLPPMMRR
jgi:hypothetical protein